MTAPSLAPPSLLDSLSLSLSLSIKIHLFSLGECNSLSCPLGNGAGCLGRVAAGVETLMMATPPLGKYAQRIGFMNGLVKLFVHFPDFLSTINWLLPNVCPQSCGMDIIDYN